MLALRSARRFIFYVALMFFRGYILYQFFNYVEDDFLVKQESGSCWYESYVPDCRGSVFDFSDHVVLYFAQLLPIALFETLYALEKPYWGRWEGVRYLLLVGLGYIYLIVSVGAYTTAVFFHTRTELLAGYCVSLFIQVPLFAIQCLDRFSELRLFLFR